MQLYVIYRRLSVVTHAQRQSNRGNEMSRDHDAPVEYLRILASLKLRFGLAALGTAHGALPVCYPIEEQGHSATQCLRWSSSFPMVALDTQRPNSRDGSSSGNTCRAEHPSTEGYADTGRALVHSSSISWQSSRRSLQSRQAASQRHILCWSTSNNSDHFVAPIRIQVTPIHRLATYAALRIVTASATALSGRLPQWTQIMLVSSSYNR